MKLSHPYTNLTGGQWVRGNLHAHSNRSDGARTPQAVIADYARRGYGFLMLSDHDLCSTRRECKAWSTRRMVIIPGNEISAHGPHLLHVNADRFVEPRRARQEVLHHIGNRGGGFAVINHPNWQEKFDHCTIHQLREWTGYVGLEIYNGVISRLDGSPYATNKWDMLLAEGRRLWGFANDDSHAAAGDTGLGWNTVYVRQRTVAAITDALRKGRFYASTGVTITGIHVHDDTIRIETQNAQRITALVNTGKRIATADDRAIEVKVPPYARYIRFECWGPGEAFAWTQPFFVEDGPARGAAPTKGKSKSRSTPFIQNWRVSTRVIGADLSQAKPDTADNLKWTPVRCWDNSDPAPGLVDARKQIQGAPGLVYFRTTLKSPSNRRARLFLGYDGPVRVWLNHRQLFDGPGSNPCNPDRTALFAPLNKGANDLTIALDTNNGNAWGIMARVEM